MSPHGRRASSTVSSPCGHGRERAKPYSVGQRPYSVVRGHRLNFTKALRAAGRPPVASGGWLGLSGGQGRGVHDGIGALPDSIGLCPLATVPARAWYGGGTVELARRPCGGIVRGPCPQGPRWNWLAACAGASSEFYEGSPSRREAALWRPWAAGYTTEKGRCPTE